MRRAGARAENYLLRLIRHGHRVAICEQMEDPAEAKKRGGKSVVRARRDPPRHPRHADRGQPARRPLQQLPARAGPRRRGGTGLAWLDLSTGEMTLQPVRAGLAGRAPAARPAARLVLPERLFQRARPVRAVRRVGQPADAVQPNSRFDSEKAGERLLDLFGVGPLDAFGNFSRAEIAAAGALVDYVELTQKGRRAAAQPAARDGARRGSWQIDAATRRNLELTRTLTGERSGSLLAAIDRTVTGPGARLLAAAAGRPARPTRRRSARGSTWWRSASPSDRTRADCARAAAPVPRHGARPVAPALGRGGPRDLAGVRDGLARAAAMRRVLASCRRHARPAGIERRRACALGEHCALIDQLDAGAGAGLPLLDPRRRLHRAGLSRRLDELRALRDESRRLIAALQARYADETGVGS